MQWAQKGVAKNLDATVPCGRVAQHRMQASAVQAGSAKGRVGLENEGIPLNALVVARGGKQSEVLQPLELREQADGKIPFQHRGRQPGTLKILGTLEPRQFAGMVAAAFTRDRGGSEGLQGDAIRDFIGHLKIADFLKAPVSKWLHLHHILTIGGMQRERGPRRFFDFRIVAVALHDHPQVLFGGGHPHRFVGHEALRSLHLADGIQQGNIRLALEHPAGAGAVLIHHGGELSSQIHHLEGWRVQAETFSPFRNPHACPALGEVDPVVIQQFRPERRVQCHRHPIERLEGKPAYGLRNDAGFQVGPSSPPLLRRTADDHGHVGNRGDGRDGSCLARIVHRPLHQPERTRQQRDHRRTPHPLGRELLPGLRWRDPLHGRVFEGEHVRGRGLLGALLQCIKQRQPARVLLRRSAQPAKHCHLLGEAAS